jgi:hypothetical protein
MRVLFLALSGLSLLSLAGCSISDSVSASFDSSASSVSSSGSSSGSSSADRESYRNDVRDYTDAYVKSGGQFESFTRGLTEIATKHGVSDWEADQDTFVGIGTGLKKAGVTPTQLEVWKTNLANGDATRAASIQKGYGQ